MKGYFDYNATTPLFSCAKDALIAAMDAHWHNPSSLYHQAGAAKQRLEEARELLANALELDEPERVVFTSGATESNNLVISHQAALGKPVWISAVEHPCVREPARRAFGDALQEIPVTSEGTVDLDQLEAMLEKSSPGLISVMAANNETGVQQPWQSVRDLARKYEVPYHCDAAQWVGKMPLEGLGDCDWITGSAHKFGGPKGCGFLIVPEGVDRLEGSALGGPQERGLRAGTENYPAIEAMVSALEQAEQLRVQAADTQSAYRDQFEARIRESIQGSKVVAASAPRLWNTGMLVVPAHNNLKWLTRLSHLGFQISTGSACSSGKDNPSHVMEAMGLTYEEMGRVLRISGGWETSEEDWQGLAEALEAVAADLEKKGSKKSVDLSNPEFLG